MAESPRSRARELVLQALYAMELTADHKGPTARELIADEHLEVSALEYGRALFDRVCARKEWADSNIAELAANWELQRIALVDRLILRMAMTELTEMADVPVKVVLNEAIELAKQYSTADSSAFVNGILDTFVRRLPESSRP